MTKSTSVWYPRYVGDYKRKTSHLSMTEHGAYALLMDHYYSTGKPLPTNVTVLKRVCSAFEAAEIDAMNAVLCEFFTIEDSEYHHARADEELVRRSDISIKRQKAVNSRRDRAHTNVPTNVTPLVNTATVTVLREESVSKETATPTLVPKNLEVLFFQEVKRLFGAKAGGFGARLRNHYQGDLPRCLAALDLAETKQDPREYIGGILRNAGAGRTDDVLAESAAMYRKMGVT